MEKFERDFHTESHETRRQVSPRWSIAAGEVL